MTWTSRTSANMASKPFSVPCVSQTGMPWRRASRATPPMWSSCSWVTTIAARSVGSRPRRPRRLAVSARPKPQSSRTRVVPDSTTRALPWLPLPREAKRMPPVTRSTACAPASALFQLRLQQGKDAAGTGLAGLLPLGVQHAYFAALVGAGHADAELLLLLGGVVAPECELGHEASRLLVDGIRIHVANVVQALGAVAILDGKPDTVQG